jgi:hypothetical protein
VKNTWSFTIQAMSILNGGLQLQVNIPIAQSDLFVIDHTSGGDWFSLAKLDNCSAQFAEFLSTYNISSTAGTLQGLLNKTAKFFLPGAGNLFYKNPVFNNESDILVEASYNG